MKRERLADKLNPAIAGAAAPAGNGAVKPHEPCFIRTSGPAFACSFQENGGSSWLFPANQFLAAWLSKNGGSLRIVYGAGEVHLKGSRLDRVREALVRGQAFQICAVNPSYRSEYDDEVFVSEVSVRTERPLPADVEEAPAP